MKMNINIYKSSGVPRRLKVFSFEEDEPVNIPDDSIILHTQFYPDYDVIEVWAAVPDTSIIASSEVQHDLKKLQGPERAEAETGLVKPEYARASEINKALDDGGPVEYYEDEPELYDQSPVLYIEEEEDERED
ncbi:MAG: hypothetical protein NWE76_01385 [Candidatus Bathyarchaeota archaeon]|nr:hypothetical protein [Candidatus Bathyarchaeota archaeon]